MAFDGKGKYHMSPHHAKMADGFKDKPPKSEDGQVAAEESGEEGPHEMLQALQEAHGGKHMHVHAHEDGVTTHHVGEDGEVQGPHHHASMEEAADHMHSVMGDGMDAEEMPAHKGGAMPAMSGY